MNNIFYLVLLGFCLGIDAFSVSINIGWQIQSSIKGLFFTIVIGILHFFMPLLGAFLATYIRSIIHINTDLVMGLILLFIAFGSAMNLNENNKQYQYFTYIILFIIALGVSLDSFSIGIALQLNKINIFRSGIIFLLCSSLMTYAGLILSKYLSNKFENNFRKLGIIMLLILGIIHILK